MRRVGVLAVVVAAVCWPASLALAADRPVGMGPASFEPKSITVAPGDRVVWSNTSTRAHTVTSDDGTMFDQPVPPGGTFAFTFAQPGSVAYYCRFHGSPGGGGMSGTVVVQGQSPTTVPPTTAPPQVTTTARPATTTTARATTTTSPATTTTEPATTTSSSTTSSSTTSTTELATGPEDDDGDDDGSAVPLVLIVLGLLAVLGAGGYGLWRLWPRDGAPTGDEL